MSINEAAAVTDYEREYQRNPSACGEPFPAFVAFFERLPAPSTVLDLGAGQGRDTLVAARLGHRVVAVDASPTGIRQILEAAQREGLAVEGVVGDLMTYYPDRQFDVVVLDRVVHMFRAIEDRAWILKTAAEAIRTHGHVLIADVPGNQALIDQEFGDARSWAQVFSQNGCQIYRREVGARLG